MSLKVLNVIQLDGKTMIQRELSNYALSSTHLHKYKSYFQFIVMSTGYLNLKKEEIHSLAELTNASVIDVSGKKIDGSVLNIKMRAVALF